MNAIAAYVVFDHLERMREESARERRARPVDLRPSRIRRLGSVIAATIAQARSSAAPAAPAAPAS